MQINHDDQSRRYCKTRSEVHILNLPGPRAQTMLRLKIKMRLYLTYAINAFYVAPYPTEPLTQSKNLYPALLTMPQFPVYPIKDPFPPESK